MIKRRLCWVTGLKSKNVDSRHLATWRGNLIKLLPVIELWQLVKGFIAAEGGFRALYIEAIAKKERLCPGCTDTIRQHLLHDGTLYFSHVGMFGRRFDYSLYSVVRLPLLQYTAVHYSIPRLRVVRLPLFVRFLGAGIVKLLPARLRTEQGAYLPQAILCFPLHLEWFTQNLLSALATAESFQAPSGAETAYRPFASLKFNRPHCFVVVVKRAAVFSFAPLFQHGIESEFSKT